VPGVGDFGDRYYGTTGYAEGLWGTNGRWHFPGWAFGPRGASMRQPRPCDVKREEKRQYIDAKKKAKKRQSRNHVAGVEPTQWPHCNGTWIDRYIISKLMVSDIPSYPIQTNPMNVHKNYHHGNHSHDPAGHPLGPSIRQEQRHLESLWPVGDPGGFHGEIWCRMVSDSMGTSEMGRNGYHKYWFNRDSMGYLYIYIYTIIYIYVLLGTQWDFHIT
jgi:Zn-finger nucleic acid-binding protein